MHNNAPCNVTYVANKSARRSRTAADGMPLYLIFINPNVRGGHSTRPVKKDTRDNKVCLMQLGLGRDGAACIGRGGAHGLSCQVQAG